MPDFARSADEHSVQSMEYYPLQILALIQPRLRYLALPMVNGKEELNNDPPKTQSNADNSDSTGSTDKSPSEESKSAKNDSSEDSSVSQMPSGDMPDGQMFVDFGGKQQNTFNGNGMPM